MPKKKASTGDEEPPAAKRARPAPAPVDAAARDHFVSTSRPPATISLRTGRQLHLSAAQRELWASAEGGKSAARRGPTADQLRLIGSVQIRVTPQLSGPNQQQQLATLLGTTQAPARPRQADPKWCGSRKAADAVTESWDAKTGEVSGQGFVLPSKLLKALLDGKLIADEVCARPLSTGHPPTRVGAG
eukprot:4610292-Prymnesium_polylepis.1